MDAAHPDDMDGRNVEGVDGSGVKTGIIGEVGCTWPLISNERKSLADISRGIIGHLDRTVFDVDTLHRIASSGCYLEWDLFGNEGLVILSPISICLTTPKGWTTSSK